VNAVREKFDTGSDPPNYRVPPRRSFVLRHGRVATASAVGYFVPSVGTRVTIRRGGLAAHPDVARSYRGWPSLLGWLRDLPEHGETVDDRKPVTAS